MFLDTIAAIATPLGEAGIGVVRLSGPAAQSIALGLLRTARGEKLGGLQDHRVYYGKVVDPQTEQPVDEVIFFYAARPHSFTAEDTVEIQAHGSSYIVQRILELLLANGARLAEPGEFTQRAFLNGRIDLVQAEAVIDLIRAKTAKAHQLALNQLAGEPSRVIGRIEAALYDMLIHIEAVLDFPEEGIPDLQRAAMIDQSRELHGQLSAIYDRIDEGRKIKEGITLVITGRPNVGKSSILNALLGEEKAIVTPIPGTTRDLIEGFFQLQGVPIRLVDTAGLRPTDNPIEQIGIERARKLLDQADLVLFIVDNGAPFSEEDRAIAESLADKPVLLIVNKTDLPAQLDRAVLAHFQPLETVELSVVQRRGFERLEKAIIDLVGLGKLRLDDQPLLNSVRHKEALRQALDGLAAFREGMELSLTEDLLAVELRAVLAALGEITGKNVNEEVLHGIFAQFCIGK
jgi:tRNA modification GTPase